MNINNWHKFSVERFNLEVKSYCIENIFYHPNLDINNINLLEDWRFKEVKQNVLLDGKKTEIVVRKTAIYLGSVAQLVEH